MTTESATIEGLLIDGQRVQSSDGDSFDTYNPATGQVIAKVWPPEAASSVAEHLALGHVAGAYRTLPQDVSFGFDQLVEIAIRALSPAVNDTYTALTCVDWLGNTLCKLAKVWRPAQAYRDRSGAIRVICEQVSYQNLVHRSFDKGG